MYSKQLTEYPRLIHDSNTNEILSIGQCDCAYPMDRKMPPRHLTFEGDFLFERTPFRSFPLSEGFYAIVGNRSDFANLNTSALDILDHFKKKNSLENIKAIFRNQWDGKLIESVIAQMVGLRLLVPGSEQTTEFNDSPTILSAWIHVTDRCNLRCEYCYLPRTQTDMSHRTGKAAVDAVFRSALIHGYQTVQLKYGGGEPLLGFDLITKLHDYAVSLSDRNGIALEGVILSNGTRLTRAMARRIRGLGLRLAISLDGPERFHDRCRVYPDGSGSFKDVSNAIDMAVDTGLAPGISITVGSNTVGGLPTLLDQLLERDLPFRVNFFRGNPYASQKADLQLEEDKMVTGMLAAYKAIESKPSRRSLLGSLGDHASFFSPKKRPCNAGHSYLVFDTRGNVAKCQMEIRKTMTTANDPDPLGRIRNSRIGLVNPRVDEKPECDPCQWKHWCAGGCPLAAYRSAGKYEGKSPNCGIYKRVFPEIIRLEGLRLLQSGKSSGSRSSKKM